MRFPFLIALCLAAAPALAQDQPGPVAWANTAVRVLDTFTGPGAPFDTSPRQPWNRCAPYRCDSSVSAPGIR